MYVDNSSRPQRETDMVIYFLFLLLVVVCTSNKCNGLWTTTNPLIDLETNLNKHFIQPRDTHTQQTIAIATTESLSPGHREATNCRQFAQSD